MFFSLLDNIIKMSQAVLALVHNRLASLIVPILEVNSVLFARSVIVALKGLMTRLRVDLACFLTNVKISPNSYYFKPHF